MKELETGQSGEGLFVNETDLPDEEVAQLLKNWQMNQEMEIATITNWSNAWSGNSMRKSANSIFNQDAYVIPENIFDQMRTASFAAKYDDIVGNAVDITEQVAFKRIGIESSDPESADIGKQILDQLNLVEIFREVWREVFITSNCYVAVKWARKDFKLREPTRSEKARKRKKIYKNLLVPVAVSVLDPLKIIPVGNFLFGDEKLAYIASPDEAVRIDEFLAGNNSANIDPSSMFVARYTPSEEEAKLINGSASSSSRAINKLHLYELNPDVVFRITATRPAYQRFSDVRMASVFELLDLKHNLRESDRSDILGNINSLVIVKKGDKDLPTNAAELKRTASQFRGNGRNSVVVTDHRIDVEIITKKTDKTLQPERYNTLDSRLTARLFQLFQTGNYCKTPDTEILTKTGWKNYTELSIGELVLTLDPDTQESVWEPVQAINVFNYEGKMLKYEDNKVSSMSTPNHRWFVRKNIQGGKDGRWGFTTSENLTATDRIPLVAPHREFPTEALISDEIVRLMGWYWTEGSRSYLNGNRFSISQCPIVNPDNWQSIYDDLESLWGSPSKVEDGGNWFVRDNNFHVSASVGNSLLKYIDRSTPKNLKLPTEEFLSSLTEKQMRDFVSISIAGDGSIDSSHPNWNDKICFFAKNMESIDILRRCAILLDMPTTVVPHNESIWRLTFTNARFGRGKMTSYSNPDSFTWVDYEGIVWCPTTPNGTWFARRDNKIYWTGNSSGTATDNSAGLFKVTAASMDARRETIRDIFSNKVIEKIWERNEELRGSPSLTFYPRRIALDFDPHYSTLLKELLMIGRLSGETMLDELDVDFREEMDRVLDEFELFGPPGIHSGNSDTMNGIKGSLMGGNQNGGGVNTESFEASPNKGRGKDGEEQNADAVKQD